MILLAMKKTKLIKTAVKISSNNLKLFMYLFLMWSLAVAQPLMVLFGNQPDFLIAHEMRGWSLFIFTILLSFLIPVFLWLLLVMLGFVSSRLKEWTSRIIVALLIIFLFLPIVDQLSYQIAICISVVCSFLLVLALLKIDVVRTFALWFSPLSLIFTINFLFFSPAKQLVFSQAISILNNKSNITGPIFIFVLDEFPLISILETKNKIDSSRFPAFAELAKNLTWYPNASAISNSTTLVLPAILSGIEPSKTQELLATYEQYPNNLFTQFSKSHSMHVVENTSRLCPQYLCKSVLKNPYQLVVEDTLVSFLYKVYPQDLRKYLPPINDRWVGFMREFKNRDKSLEGDFSERLAKFTDFIDSIDSYPVETVHFLHVLIPHAPWKILPDLSLYGFYERDGIPGELSEGDPASTQGYSHQWTDDAWATNLSWRKHLLQVGAVDSLIAKAVKKIKSLGLYDQATIVVVADHGSAFIPNMSRRFAHGDNFPDIASIPLFIKYPNQKQGIIDYRYANNLDILPTILDVFEIDYDKDQMDGLNLKGQIKRKNTLDLIQENHTTTVIPTNYQEMFDKSLKEKNTHFPVEGWKGIFQMPSNESFYSKEVETLEIRSIKENAINLKNENLFKNINSNNSYYIPSYYRIQNKAKDNSVKEILVSLNDKLISHCYMFVHEKNDCAGLIDPEIFKKLNDKNELNFRFFSVISKANGKYTVDELLTKENDSAQIVVDNNKEFIRFDSGQIIPVLIKGQPYGEATLRLVNGSTYQVDGWAGDTINGTVADKIYMFIDNKLFTVANTGVPKNYVHKKYGFEALIDSGFQITIPFNQYPQMKNHRIRVFASLNNQTLSEVNYHSDPKQHDLFQSFDTSNTRRVPKNNTAILAMKLKSSVKKVYYSQFDTFNDAFEEISTGDWFNIDNHSRWIGSNAFMILPLDKNIDFLTFSLTAKPLIYPGKLEKQRLLIYINETLVSSLEFVQKSTHKIIVDLKKKERAEHTIIRLEMPDSAAPSDYIDSKDRRKLSLLLTDFRIDTK